MKFCITEIKYIKPRGLILLDLILRYPPDVDNHISYKSIYTHYNIRRIGYNGYSKIKIALFNPHIPDIEKYLGIKIMVYKINNKELSIKHILKLN